MSTSHKSGFGATGVIFYAFFTFAAMAGAGTYSGGSGTAEDPYKISTVADWQEFMTASGDWSKNFILIADLDLADVALTPIGKDIDPTDYDYTGTPFSGVFEGNGHIIRNATINIPDADYMGLFGCMGKDGRISNLGIENVHVVGNEFVGGLLGINGNHDNPHIGGTVNNCFSFGYISGMYCIGGLIGSNYGSACTACYSGSTVHGNKYVGGLIGSNICTVDACYSIAEVSGEDYIGCLIGSNSWDAAVLGCFWLIRPNDETGNSGGKGLTDEQMKTTRFYQNAGWGGKGWVIREGQDYPRLAWEKTGGEPIPEPEPVPLSGSGTLEDPFQIRTTDDFALLSQYTSILDTHIALMNDLDLTGVALCPIGDLGPFTGVFDGNHHSLRNATLTMPTVDYVGIFGYVGSSGSVRNVNLEGSNLTGRQYVGGLVGYNSGFLNACTNSGEVRGEGTIGGLIGSNAGSVLDCHSEGVTQGVWIVGGLIGYGGIGYFSIQNCSSAGFVSGDGHIGGLVGYNSTRLIRCFSTSKVIGGIYAGGLVGTQHGSGCFICFAKGPVSGDGEVGGLVGFNNHGMIENSYAEGTVDVNDGRGGGLIGFSFHGLLRGSYATGKVVGNGAVGLVLGGYPSSGRESFWDIETTGQETSTWGIGKTTTEMKTKATFVDAGWDFVGETANGTEDVWRMCGDGVDYPRLAWEFSDDGDLACPNGVALEDLMYLSERWLADTPETIGAADADGNGKVNLVDLAILSENWEK